MALLVVDASVVLTWLRNETDAAWARALVRQPGTGLLAPELLLSECANVLWRIQRRGEATLEHVTGLLDALMAYPLAIEAIPRAVHGHALRLAAAMAHPAYDCLYLALALDQEAALATANRRFAAAIRGAGMLPGDRLFTPP